MSDNVFRINDTSLAIRRPHNHARGLRGWDAADELLIDQALAILGRESGQRVLVIDDQFGALTLGLQDFSPVSVSDSATLASALRINNPMGRLGDLPASWIDAPAGRFDLVVMRIPRQADYLAWLLRWVNKSLSSSGLIIAGGMIKHIPDRSAALFKALVHTQTVLPARKKARVILATPGAATLDDWLEQWQGYRLPETDMQIDALPAVFSRRKLDIGTRELLPFISAAATELAPGSRVLDLACGNGVLGLAVLARRSDLRLAFSDVSSQALLSARHNVTRALPGAAAEFFHSDGVPEGEGDFDLIVLNPPFHEAGVVGDHIAIRLFEAARRAVKSGGRLMIVGNRHLGYHRTLRQFYTQVRQLASSPKFVVFEASFQDPGRS